jgi:hypothetical protein
MGIDELIKKLETHGIVCKHINGTCGDKDFVAIFSHGDLTDSQIDKMVSESGNLCLMFNGNRKLWDA